MSHDLWERKDAERARFRKKHGGTKDLFSEIQESQRPLGFLICLALLLACEVPTLPPTIRLILTAVGTIGIILLLALYTDFTEPVTMFIRRVPNILFSLSLLVGLIAFFLGPDRGLAVGELLRLVSGASAYLFSSYVLRDRRDVGIFIGGLILLGVGISLYDIAHFSQLTGFNKHLTPEKISVFGTHESIGSLLALLLPLVLSFAFSPVLEEKRRIAAQAASLVLIFAWAIVRCRSAWIGGAAGIALLIALLLRYGMVVTRSHHGQKPPWLSKMLSSPALLVAGAVVFLGVAGGIAPLLSARLATASNLLEDTSLQGRMEMWNGALRMLSEKPIWGWGLGGYLLLQGEWTHLGDSPQEVILYGTAHQNLAHNYYVQWAADTGVVGVFLFIALISSLMINGLVSAKMISNKWEKMIVFGTVSSVFCGIIEIIGSPAFQFSGVWSVFWSISGLIIGVNRRENIKISIIYSSIGLLLSAIIAGSLLWLGKRAWDPKGEPRGVYQLFERTKGPYFSGDTIRWRAVYSDANGTERGTTPGTSWVKPRWYLPGSSREVNPVLSQDLRLERIPFSASDLLRGYSELVVRLPEGETGMIQIQAFYRDRFGRDYSAMRVANVKKK